MLLGMLLTASVSVVTAMSTPPPGHHDLDCKLRKLAKEFATHIRPNTSIEVVSDALQLDLLCGTEPAEDETVDSLASGATNDGVAALAAETIEAAALVAYVDPLRGNDAVGDGSPQAPFITVARGLKAVRSGRSGGAAAAALVLRGGTHFVSGTLALSAADSHLSIVAAPGERATLSGGAPLGELIWTKDAAQGVYSAQLPPPPPGAQYAVFDTLYEPSGRRAIRARYPK